MARVSYEIHPSVGIARIGNADSGTFYLAPNRIGGLPIECDSDGNARRRGRSTFVANFKHDGKIRPQAASFSIYRHGETVQEVFAGCDEIERIAWTVHLANKKACWYDFREEARDHRGNQRNMTAQSRAERRRLIVDPGPRTLNFPSRRKRTAFTKKTGRAYEFMSFPRAAAHGTPDLDITSLGEMLTDKAGRLIVVGAAGAARGPAITAQLDGWHDDIADGPVTCTLFFRDGSQQDLTAWCIVAPPKFAPQLTNAVSLDDVMFDVAVRNGDVPQWYTTQGGWQSNASVDFDRDIAPIFKSAGDLAWVAKLPGVLPFATPPFDARNNAKDAATISLRQRHAQYFRERADTLALNGVPMMPLQAGDAVLSRATPGPFLTLTKTQLYILRQWVQGNFTTSTPATPPRAHDLDRAATGNCVGGPLAPGVEVSWSVRERAIYDGPGKIKHRHASEHYRRHGLDPCADDLDGTGCEPGDLTKRLSVPWQADFYMCNDILLTFASEADEPHRRDAPLPPMFSAYWWPVQVPADVLSGSYQEVEQDLAGVPAGVQVPFSRGLNSFADVLAGWSYLGFVLDRNTEADGAYPYFVETQREHARFVVAAVAVGAVTNTFLPDDRSFTATYYLRERQNFETSNDGRHGRRRRHLRY